MCNSNNSNQAKLNEVISQMTALTHAVDELRAEVNAIKVKSLLIQNERINNESTRRAMIDKNCKKKNCVALSKLSGCVKSRTHAVYDHCTNVGRNSGEKFNSPPPLSSKSQVPDFSLNSPPYTPYSKNISSNTSSIITENDRSLTSENKNNKDKKNEDVNIESKLSVTSGTTKSNDSAGNTPKLTKKIELSNAKQTSENIPTQTRKVDTKNAEAGQDINTVGAEVEKDNNQLIEPKKSSKKSPIFRRRKEKQKVTHHSKDSQQDSSEKSDQESENSLSNNENEETATCMDSFRQNFGSLCTPLSRPRKKADNAKSVTTEQKRMETQSLGRISSDPELNSSVGKTTGSSNKQRGSKNRKIRKKQKTADSRSPSTATVETESDSLIGKLTKTANRKRNGSKKIPKNKKQVKSPSSSTTTVDTKSDSSVEKSKKRAKKRKNGNSNRKKSNNQKTARSPSSSTATVDTQSHSSIEKPADIAKKRKSRNRRKSKNQKKARSPSSSTTTVDTQSNSSIAKPANTSKKKRSRKRNKTKQQKSIKLQSFGTTTLSTESDTSVEKTIEPISEKKSSVKKNTAKNPKTTADEQVKVLYEDPKINNERQTQTYEEPAVNPTKCTETILEESSKNESPKTVKITDAAVGTERKHGSKKYTENISTESNSSLVASTTSGNTTEEQNALQTILAKETAAHLPGCTTTEQSTSAQCCKQHPEVMRFPNESYVPTACQRRKKLKEKHKKWLSSLKKKDRSARCGSRKPIRIADYKLPQMSRDVDCSTQALTSSEVFPLVNQQTIENYHVSPSISKSGLRRRYPFSDTRSYPTRKRYDFSKTKRQKNKEMPHPYHQKLVLNHLRNFNPRINHVASQFNSLAAVTTDSSVTLDDSEQFIIGGNTSRERRYSGRNNPYVPGSSYSSNFDIGKSATHKSHVLDTGEPQLESRRPALLQRVVNYFFSRKSSQYIYHPRTMAAPRLAGYHTCVESPTAPYIYRASPPSLQTPPPYTDNVVNPSRYEYLMETERIPHNFDESRNVYTLMPVLTNQRPHISGKRLHMVEVSDRMYACPRKFDNDIVTE